MAIWYYQGTSPLSSKHTNDIVTSLSFEEIIDSVRKVHGSLRDGLEQTS